MPTRTEAAEALYRAAQNVSMNWRTGAPQGLDALGIAITSYEDSTPDPLPAEVQRVVEAALEWRADMGGVAVYGKTRALRDAVDAYRSTQPEPLSARLPRLGKGAEVATELVPRFAVLANSPERRCLFVDAACFDFPRSVPYHDVTAILSEAP